VALFGNSVGKELGCGNIHLSILIPSHVILIDCGTRTPCQLVPLAMQTFCLPWSTTFQRTFWLALWGEGKGGVDIYPPSNCHSATLATTAGAEEGKRGLGKYVVYRNVWHHGICFGHAILQTWYQVRYQSLLCPNLLFTNNFWDSVQTWALQEAKGRMEARGEKYQYEPQPTPPWLSYPGIQ